MLKLIKIIAIPLFLVSASFAQSPLLTLMSDDEGILLGDELITDGEFNNAGNWTVYGETTVSDGVCRIYSSAGGFTGLEQADIYAEIGKTYLITYTVIATDAGNDPISDFNGVITYPQTLGTHQLTIVSNASNFDIKRVVDTDGIVDVTIDNLSVKEVLNP